MCCSNAASQMLMAGWTADMDREREFWLQFRQALLMVVDIIERFKLPELPRTSKLREERKGNRE